MAKVDWLAYRVQKELRALNRHSFQPRLDCESNDGTLELDR